VVVTLPVVDTTKVDFEALRKALAVAGGIWDQRSYRADFVTMLVTADSPTVVRVHLSGADKDKLYEVKLLMMNSFDSKEEANQRFGAAGRGSAVVTGAPFFYGLTPPPPPPPTLQILFTVRNTADVDEEMLAELTGAAARACWPLLLPRHRLQPR